MTARLVVLVSGSGTNLAAIMKACKAKTLDAKVVGVVSNRADAYGLERAETAGIPAVHVPVGGRSRVVYDGVLASAVEQWDPTIVVLAGWMRLLSNPFLARFAVLNLHPALPGALPGLNAIPRAFDAWQQGHISESGVMVHWVPDEGVDSGPVIASQVVPFGDADTLELFEARIHRAEHELIVTAIATAITELTTEVGQQ